MKKFALDITDEEETLFYGLLSNEKVSRLAWLLNHSLEINLARVDSIEWYNESEREYFYFNKFIYNDELNHLTYTLFANSDESKILFTELRAMQYFILIEGGLSFFDEKLFLKQVKTISEIQLVSLIDQTRLKQKVNLIL
ncbi:MAG: IPExxxVDY family protein [Bacteroidia bacterium]